ncbi:MAG: TIGR01777 family protein [Bdellovibrionales bacterium]|nr:TIGR01777 family protein [Bdellovibrionales bacterium]
MRILLAGGTGQIGQILEKEYVNRGYKVFILTRTPVKENHILWDGKSVGKWSEKLEGLDLIINLAGQSVKCSYTKKNLKTLYDSRIDSTKVLALALQKTKQSPKLWIQMSAATIYSHLFEGFNDEFEGNMGFLELPKNWGFISKLARDWEEAVNFVSTNKTRKVIVRMSFLMSPQKGGFFSICSKLSHLGLGGSLAGGKQFISWIHDKDFISAIDYIIKNEDLKGPVNFSTPHPISQKDFMKILRKEWKIPFSLPVTRTMAKIGAFVLKLDTQLILRSSKVIPRKLLNHGFSFQYPHWKEAVQDLVTRYKQKI